MLKAKVVMKEGRILVDKRTPVAGTGSTAARPNR